ncbi:MAG: glycosyltransferase family 2 protein [bacterium]|nr:glycosyltransferase family 2 protein [bacterium]
MLYPEDKTTDLSISIVSYNVKRLLGLCLESIQAHTKGISYQVIVVDNGSRDGTVAMLAEKFPWVKVMANRKNRGFAAAQNTGLGMGRGRYLFSLDSDTYITEDTFTAMVRFMDKYPQAGAAGAKLLSPQGVRQYSRRRFPPSIWPVLYRGSFLKNILPPSAQVRYYEMSDVVLASETEVDWVYGGNIIFRRQALEQVGLFDERFFIYCEDIDISYRLQEHGWKRYFVPDARIFHYGQQGTNQIKVRSYCRHVLSYLKLFQKYDWKLDERYTKNFDRKETTTEMILLMVCSNQKGLLAKCLEKIYQNPPAVPFKVVVVDEASQDGTLEYLKAERPEIAWISNKKPKGYLRAVNQAIKMTESKYLVLVPLVPAAIYGQMGRLHDFMEHTDKAGMAGMVSDGKGPSFLPENDLNEKELFLANCMMVRRNLRGLSLLDEKTGKKDNDFEWCSRFRKAGWAVYYLLNT